MNCKVIHLITLPLYSQAIKTRIRSSPKIRPQPFNQLGRHQAWCYSGGPAGRRLVEPLRRKCLCHQMRPFALVFCRFLAAAANSDCPPNFWCHRNISRHIQPMSHRSSQAISSCTSSPIIILACHLLAIFVTFISGSISAPLRSRRGLHLRSSNSGPCSTSSA